MLLFLFKLINLAQFLFIQLQQSQYELVCLNGFTGLNVRAADKSGADPCLQTRTNWDKDGGLELSLTLDWLNSPRPELLVHYSLDLNNTFQQNVVCLEKRRATKRHWSSQSFESGIM